KALNEIRNSQVRNVLNDSTRTISKKRYNKSKEEINSEVKEVKVNKQELKTSADNNVSTYKQNSEKVDTKKDEAKKVELSTANVGKISEDNKKLKSSLKKEKSEVASLTLSRNSENEEEKIYSNITKSTTGDLFVREKADKESEAIGVLPKDTKVVVKDDGNKSWAKISYKNKEAYVSKDFLANEKSGKKVVSEAKKQVSKNNTEVKEVKSNSAEKSVDMWVKSPVYIRSEKSISSNKLGVLEKNTKVQGVVEDGWFKTSVNGNNGFISIKYLQNSKIEEKQNDKHQISEAKKKEQVNKSNSTKFEGTNYTGYVKESVNVRDKDSMDSNVVSVLEKGTKVSGIKGEYWLKLSEGRYISVNYIQDSKVEPNQTKNTEVKDSYKKDSNSKVVRSNEGGSGSAVAQAAYNYLGERYVWGSAQPGVGFDCSGLTSYLYNKVCGISLYRNSAAQSNNGYPVSKSNLKQGDLLFFSTNGSG
ncbi:MAG: SH3 domain-containing protein, partial [Finegoldia magna]